MASPVPRFFQNVTVHCAIIVTSLGCSAADPASRGRANNVLDAALANLGGVERLRAVRSWIVTGNGRENLSAERQGLSPGEPTWREHAEATVVDARTSTVGWQRRTPRNDMSLRWRRFVYGPNRFGFLDLTSDRGMWQQTAVPDADRRALMRRIPHLLLLEANASDVSWRGETALGADTTILCDVIDVVTSDGAALTLYVSKQPAVLRRVAYQTHLPTRGDVRVDWDWYGWRPDSMLGFVPAGHRVSIDTAAFQEVEYDQYAGNVMIDEWFDIPDMSATMGSDEQRAPGSSLASTGEVAPGVHVNTVRGFGVMLIEFDEYVVMVEAPAAHPGFERIPASLPGNAVSDEHAEWVRTIAGEKPVRYVVITHHHSDHLGGLRAFASGATIVASPGDEDAVRELLARSHTIAADVAPFRAGHSVAIETVSDRWVLQDDAKTVEVIQVGANPHTDENVLVWIPGARMLFQGDLFYIGANQSLPASRATMNSFFVRWLAERGIRPAAVYGVHNPEVAGPEALLAAEQLVNR